jgi:dinuclear metal center YbgI/SA1388 family protein
MNVSRVVEVLESIAPPHYAEPWDNVGLLVGSSRWAAEHVLLTIDLTEAVLHEAIQAGTQMIVAYHPVIFEPMRSLTDVTTKQRVALEAASAGIAVYSPHTALDAAKGGVNDWLAQSLGDGDVRALVCCESLPESEQFKVVTFCPPDAVDQLRNSLASIGAGRIGDYELCSFELRGTGTFQGGEGTNPTIGERGNLERADEVRLEMVCPGGALGLATLTLREFHPYEEPPIEIYQLQPRRERHIGTGRRVVLDRRSSLKDLAESIKAHLGISQVRVARGRGAPDEYQTIGLSAGAGGSLLDAAIQQNCEMFVTGELRHHSVLDAQERGCTVVLCGHTNTERGYLRVLQKTIAERLPRLTITVAKGDRDPLEVM